MPGFGSSGKTEGDSASPPASYSFAGYDLFDNLAAIRSKLTGNAYSNEYEFQKELYEKVFTAGHDGHLYLYPDLLSRATRFYRPYTLVSISEGGALPTIKVYNWRGPIAAHVEASAVTHINGEAAVDFLGDYVRKYSGNQDFDAGYNAMFYQQAQFASSQTRGDFASGGGGSLIYHGSNTTLTFANGTSVSAENIAQLVGNWTGIVDGPSFYAKFCVPRAPKHHPEPETAINGSLPGYPSPVIMSSDGQVSGYYLKGEGYESTAVLALLSFEPKNPDEFQAKVATFLSMAKKAGKTKLVIDLQANGGGYIDLGYDLFRQLFPSIEQNGYSRWKESSSFLGIAHTYSEEMNTAFASNGTMTDPTKNDYETPFPYQVDLNITNGSFETFEDKYAPSRYKETNYTQIIRMDCSNSGIHGYGNLSGMTQPFAAEDIVILYDGYCASTCTLASEMLRIQGGVKSVTFGGRPVAGSMQGVGGVKGAQVLSFQDIYRYVQRAAELTNDKVRRNEFARFNDLVINRTLAASVNVRDQILRDNVEDGLPAQYVYEAADCRMYWTESMLNDVSQIWRSAADAAFANSKCANGGITAPEIQQEVKRVASTVTEQLKDVSMPALASSQPTVLASHFKPAPTDADWIAQHLQKIIKVI
ncbi:hypothetical protein PWT90_10495 [Aphanocladium album]|nr:hypothetical protein PWT90_10495 [Aphanocladium album]